MTETVENIPLGERRKLVRAFRKDKRLTLAKLGKLAGLSHPMLSQFENGDSNLSPQAWKRLCEAMGEVLAEGIERRFGSDARKELADERELISLLQGSLSKEASPKTKEWLAAEMETVKAQERALGAAMAAHAERHPKEKTDVMRLFAGVKSPDGRTVPWHKKTNKSALSERLSAAAMVAEAQVCLVSNPKQEAKLRADGWQEVKSE